MPVMLERQYTPVPEIIYTIIPAAKKTLASCV